MSHSAIFFPGENARCWRIFLKFDEVATTQRMFCLDFAVAFVAHYAMASHCSEALQSHPVFTFTSGAIAGAVAAVLLYPVDQRVGSGLWQATAQPISDGPAGLGLLSQGALGPHATRFSPTLSEYTPAPLFPTGRGDHVA